MKPFIYYLGFMLLLIGSSCDHGGIGQFDDVVVDNPNNPNKFRQISFLVSVRDPTNGFLNEETIDSMKVHVNGRLWGTFSSEATDASPATHRIVNGIRYTNQLRHYLFVAPYQLKTDNLTTAGDYVQYLHDRLILTPGDYVSEIKEIKFKNASGEWITRKVQVFAPFTVRENAASAYVGNLVITIE